MKRLFVLASCALIAAACSDRPQPAAPPLGAELVGGDDHIFDLSGAVSVDPSRRDQTGPGAPQSPGNPSGPAKNVGPNVVANQDKTARPQNETPSPSTPTIRAGSLPAQTTTATSSWRAACTGRATAGRRGTTWGRGRRCRRAWRPAATP